MPRNTLTAIQVKNAKPGKLSDGGGLFLIKTETGGNWIYRYQIRGQRRQMGLGGLPHITLSIARQERDKWATMRAMGKDPIEERNRERADSDEVRDRTDPTFAEMATTAFEAKKAGLRGDGTRGRWMSPIETHMIPAIGRKRASQITARDIHKAIKPIWRTKHVTAVKCLTRTRIILQQAAYGGYAVDPAIADAAKYMLGEHVHQTKNIAATPWQDIPALYARLEHEGVTGACLQFMILTAVRSNGCRLAKIEEFDGDVWTVPSERMKGRKGRVGDFRVPMTQEALRVAHKAHLISRQRDFVFSASYKRAGISDGGIAKTLVRLGEEGRPHGFRTSFRSWVQDTEAATFDVIETALGHVVGGKVERAYARSDLLDLRRVLAEKWCQFVIGQSASVVDLRGRQA